MNNLKALTKKQLFLPIFSMILVMLVNVLFDIADGNNAFDFFSVSMKGGVLYGRIVDILNRGSEVAILALGMTLVVSCSAGTDISVGSVMSLAGGVCCVIIAGFGVTSVSTAAELAHPIWMGIACGIGAAILAGVFNGFLVAYMKIQPMVATLILWSAARALALLICNNMIVSVAILIAVLTVFHIPYEAYYKGGSLINMFLGPATACMAVTIYAKFDLLKKNWLPVLAGCLAGTLTTIVSVLVMSRLFGLDSAMTASLLPKSVTTPIATAISESHGGIVSITVAAVIFTGILGNLAAPFMIKLFRVKDPLAAGLGIGACSHAMGTAKALEIGDTEGAMSGLAIGACGIITAILALGFDFFL